ncbi:amino acid adenylation domain-containing protein [Kribbella voronezhensis]|uniref:Amino acid adenylation domain-containing protein n=1 Tax=Kribbella voronezhensis TaxID=2512212 RepID=A0A4R7TI70_9ACTN|nr:non-ribosomal peptide synthetase [Kribbella voronezhensis]TDU91248.1 amino acid adenylation domain-containing protein [Kribbella voronezhensis]
MRSVDACPETASIAAGIAAVADAQPAGTAVVQAGTAITYSELVQQADAVAAAIEVGRDDVVALELPRGIEFVVAALAVLRAGAAYLPIDPALPAARREFLLTSANPAAVLRPGLPRADTGNRTPSEPNPQDLAYVIYTSGSTGRPKGVQVPQSALSNLVDWQRRVLAMTAADRVSFVAGLGFDAAMVELWPTLVSGGTLVIPTEEQRLRPTALRDFLVEQEITVAFAPTVLAIELMTLEWPENPDLRALLTGGDRLTARPPAALPFKVYNLYGPTETAVVATWAEVAPGDDVPTIGRPVDGAVLQIRDPEGAVAQTGELFIGGAGLARGYLGRPDLTADRFVADPEHGRLYRTGDLVALRADGELDFLGRVDDQVQIRGQRVEPGEVEVVLGEHPDIVAAAVVPQDDGEVRLAGFYVPAKAGVDPREHLARYLPAHMIPATLTALTELPRTENGKVDRGALRAHRPETPTGRAPNTETEQEIAAIWEQVLGRKDLGADQQFDTVGGHSLAATRVLTRLSERWGRELPLELMFGSVTIADLAAILPPLPAPKATADLQRAAEAAPLTAAQRSYWFLDQYLADPSIYDVRMRYTIDGPLDPDRLATALDKLVERHEALRTAIETRPDGQYQRVVPAYRVPFDVLNAQGKDIDEQLAAHPQPGSDLAVGRLIRAVLASTGPDSWRLLLTIHHSAVDARSLEILLADLPILYSGRELPQPQLGPREVAAWEAQQPQAEGLAYWQEKLAGAPAHLDLITDHQRPLVTTYHGGSIRIPLPADVLTAIDRLAADERASRFTIVYAALAALLQRLTRQGDIVIGAPMANRTVSEFDQVVGCFVNTVPLRVLVDDQASFRDLLRQARSTVLETHAHQGVPLERIVADRATGEAPFDVLLVVGQPDDGPVGLGNATMRSLGEWHGDNARFDLTVLVEPVDGRMTLTVQYRDELFNRSTAERINRQLLGLLTAALADPGTTVADLPLCSEEETQQLIALGNGGDAFTERRPAYQLVAETAGTRPDKTAVVCGQEVLTYAELQHRVNQLARLLRTHGVEVGTPVAVRLPRSVAAVVAMLGVAASGGCYVPVDPELPAPRVEEMLADVQAAVILDEDFLAKAGQQSGEPLADVVGAADLVHIFSTSGSTGRPKGVLAEHGGLTNLVLAKIRNFAVAEDSRVLQFVPFGFEVSVSDVYMTLVAGATLVVRRDEVAGTDLADLIDRERITDLVLPASVLAALPDEVTLPTVRAIAVGGEACPADLVRRWAPGRHFVNSYGPTEATIAAVMNHCVADGSRPAIGRPIPGLRITIVDPRGRLVPIGVPGELLIAGVGVTRGYLDRPELTAERFTPDPYGPGNRYHTGDLAYWREDGTIMLLGRIDDQVQLRGIRIELGEVEAALTAHPDVHEAVAFVHEDATAGPTLNAYVVGAAVGLRDWLATRVPAHLVPATIGELPVLPRSASGKLDRRALPVPAGSGSPSRPPESVTEELLLALWQEALGVPELGVEDDFFAAGGQSLLAAQVMADVRDRFEIELGVRALFDAPTVARLAAAVEQSILDQLLGASS